MKKSKHRIEAVLAVALAGEAVGCAAWKRKKPAALPTSSQEVRFSSEVPPGSGLGK